MVDWRLRFITFVALSCAGTASAETFRADSGAVILDGNVLRGPYVLTVDEHGLWIGAAYESGKRWRRVSLLLHRRMKSAPPNSRLRDKILHPHDVVMLALKTAVPMRQGGFSTSALRESVAARCRQEKHLVAAADTTGTGVHIDFRDGRSIDLSLSSEVTADTSQEASPEDAYLGLAREYHTSLAKGVTILFGEGYSVFVPARRRPELLADMAAIQAGTKSKLSITSDPQMVRDLRLPRSLQGRKPRPEP